MGFSIEKGGLLTTIQDGGRSGYRNIGMPESGAMDRWAFRLANLLLRNREDSPALEITLQGPVLNFTSEAVIAICGADLNPEINGEKIAMYKRLYIKKGDVLRFGMAASGMRSYIAFKGGIKAAEQLGSASTNTIAGIGGYNGRALKPGDKIEVNSTEIQEREINWTLSSSLFSYMKKREVRVIRSLQWEWFTEEARKRFSAEKYAIRPESDRMGYRLDGPELSMKHQEELLTEGITKGTIQVPSNGQPIILMADSQPTGGYPKIANVITADLPIIAQLKPNETISFKEVSLQEAHQALREAEAEMRVARAGILLKG